MSSSVYGEVAEMPSSPGTVIFICVLVLVTALEFLFAYLQSVAERNDCEEIFSKLKQELMLLGIISFTVFVFESAATEELVNSSWFEAFDLAHILILFIAIAFIVQALFLVQYATNTGRRYLLALRTTNADLLENFRNMKTEIVAEQKSYWAMFSNSPVTELLNTIEFKIVQKRFFELHNKKTDSSNEHAHSDTKKLEVGASDQDPTVATHVVAQHHPAVNHHHHHHHGGEEAEDQSVPDEFDFAKYVSFLFHTYIAEIGEVTPESWMMLAILVALNLVRVYFIDPTAAPATCGGGEEEEEICPEYFVQYGFACGVILNVVVLALYFASKHYMHLLLCQGLKISDKQDVDGMIAVYDTFLVGLKRVEDAKDRALHHQYNPEDEHNRHFKTAALAVGKFAHEGKKAHELEVHNQNLDQSRDELDLAGAKVELQAHKLGGSGDMTEEEKAMASFGVSTDTMDAVHLPQTNRKESMKKMLDAAREKENKAIHERLKRDSAPPSAGLAIGAAMDDKDTEYRKIEDTRVFEVENLSCWTRMVNAVVNYFTIDKNPEFDNMFWLNNPVIFFKAIDFAFLLQCFYISLYLTQLLPLASKTKLVTLWVILLTIPIIVGFLIFRLILTKAVLLHTMRTLHKEVVAKVCDEVIEEETIVEEVREKIQAKMRIVETNRNDDLKGIPFKIWYIRNQFNNYDTDKSDSVDHDEFRGFLGDLGAYLTKTRFDILWKVIDFDLSGAVTWDEVFVFVFPHLKKAMKYELKIIGQLRQTVVEQLSKDANGNAVPESQWVGKLKEKFKEFDQDGNNTIDKREFCTILKMYGFNIGEKAANLLFASIDVDGGGGISMEEFGALILPGHHFEEGAEQTDSRATTVVPRLTESPNALAMNPILK